MKKQRSTNHYIENEIFSKSNMKTLPNPSLYIFYKNFTRLLDKIQGRRGRDRIVVGCIATYAVRAYHHESCELESHSLRGVLDTTLCD